ncbi:oxidoreductase NAD-binding domain-containing protein 1-like [Liolophura sinensis]|uniref:oxidoreductase NAD-binding domain-containing protein 1-like n=1 Tax=Liolophura sinensis TaxID=3198878 RepID=UPI0031591DDC
MTYCFLSPIYTMTFVLPATLFRRQLRRILNSSVMSMQTSAKQARPDHLERTANNTREDVISPATVTSITQLSATVKGLKLKVHDLRLRFKAGQWVDMTIPGVDVVGGFSMSSSPRQLCDKGMIDLAVKHSSHPPAAWVHEKCKTGDQVTVRTGGDFYYDPQPGDLPTHLLLLAGGVGINPLISILRHVTDLNQSDMEKPVQARLLYSARSEDELIYKDALISLEENHKNVKCQFFVTKELCTHPVLKSGRITKTEIEEAVRELGADQTTCYICGPFPMIKSLEGQLLTLDVPPERILYEKWW